MPTKKTRTLAYLLFLLLTIGETVLLLWTTILNKYPLIHPDTGPYITNTFSAFRSTGYYIFTRATSLNHSLWLVIIAQAVLTSLLLIRIPWVLLRNNRFKILSIITINLLLIIFTDLSKVTCWLIPDIAASWLFFGSFLLYISPRIYDRLFAATVVFLSLAFHNSHILIALLLLPILVITGIIFRKHAGIRKASYTLPLAVLLSLLIVSWLNLFAGYGFQLFPPKKAIFLIAKFAHEGTLSRTLQHYCPVKKWKFCERYAEIKAVEGKGSDFMLWDRQSSPFYRFKLFDNSKELDEIVWCAVKLNFKEIARNSLKDTFKLLQTTTSSIGGAPESSFYGTYQNIKTIFPTDFTALMNSRQQKKLPVRLTITPLPSPLIRNILLLYAVFFISILLYNRRFVLAAAIFAVFIFIIVNAFVTASISRALSRYNMRVLWMLAYMLFLTSAVFLTNRKQK